MHFEFIKPIPGSDKCFRFNDVLGDGNCMFHAIAASEHSPFPTAGEIKRALFDSLAPGTSKREDFSFLFLHYYATNDGVDVDVWWNKVYTQGIWGDDFDLGIFACVFGVNVTSYSQVDANHVLEHSRLDTTEALRFVFGRTGPTYQDERGVPKFDVNDFIPTDSPTIFLFNHCYGSPAVPVPRNTLHTSSHARKICKDGLPSTMVEFLGPIQIRTRQCH